MNNEIKNVGRYSLWGDWIPELIPAITPLLEEHEALLPPWCEIAHVKYQPDLPGADCGVDFEYRRIRLRFGSAFFALTEPERRETFEHEFAHCYAHQLYNVASELIETLLPGDENRMARALATSRLKEANEGVTQDLGRLIGRLKQ